MESYGTLLTDSATADIQEFMTVGACGGVMVVGGGQGAIGPGCLSANELSRHLMSVPSAFLRGIARTRSQRSSPIPKLKAAVCMDKYASRNVCCYRPSAASTSPKPRVSSSTETPTTLVQRQLSYTIMEIKAQTHENATSTSVPITKPSSSIRITDRTSSSAVMSAA